MALHEELGRVAAAASAFAEGKEELAGVLATEPATGERVYLCAYRAHEGAMSWLALDAAGRPLRSRALVRRAISIAGLCEAAEESAAGGDLDELRSRLMALRLTENPPGIDEAEEATLALQRAIGVPPRVATPLYLDTIGAATRRLEEALGHEGRSPFTEAMKAAAATVEELTRDVESHYKGGLE